MNAPPSSAPRSPKIGPYDLREPLGEGAVGRVYRAVDRRDGRAVALKALRLSTPDAIARFKDEFRLLKDVRHENLVELGELLERDGRWYFTMEIVDGVDLVSYVRGIDRAIDPGRDTTLDDGATTDDGASGNVFGSGCRLDRVRPAFAQLARALGALHEAGRVHRDVKPSNVLVARDGRVVLVDFGLVTEASSDRGDGEIVGTPRYMAPEQARGERVDAGADWYAVGSMLFEALTGRFPFLGRGAELLTMKQTLTPPRVLDFAPNAPADLAALCAELLAFEPSARPTASRVTGVLAGRAPEVAEATSRFDTRTHDVGGFVGREQEMDALRAALGDVRVDAGVTVLVEGESGVGKSTLARVFADEAARGGALVLWGRAFEHESVPFKALDGAIDSLVRALRRMPDAEVAALLPPRVALLAETFPVLKRVRAIRDAPADARIEDPSVRRARVFQALRALLARLAADRKVVLAIDDAQWADVDSLTMLQEVLRAPGAPPLLLLATRRTARDAPSELAEAAGAVFARGRTMTVGALSEIDARTLAERLLAHHAGAADAKRVAEIVREAAGHPLFVDALARYAGEAIEHRGPRLDEALAWRVERLPEGARRLLDAVCLVTGLVAREVGVVAAGLDAEGGARAMAELAHARLVRSSAAKEHATIEPYHDRVRQAVMSRLGEAQRREVHGKLARTFEASEQRADVEALMEHWLGAGDRTKAGGYARKAADRAFDALAFDNAAAYYRRAFDLVAPSDAASVARLAEALAHSGHCGAAAKTYEDASRLAGPVERLELQNRVAEQLLRGGHLDEGMARLRSVFADRRLVLPRTRIGAIVALAWERFVVAVLLFVLGGRAPRHDSELSPAVLARLDFAWWAGPTLGLVDPILGRLFQVRHLRYALLAGERSRLACAIAAHAGFTALAGWPVRARSARLLERARAIAGDSRDAYFDGVVAFTTHVVAYLEGRFRDERATGDECETIFRERCVGKVWECDSARFFNLSAVAYTGEMGELTRRRDDALAEARQRGDLNAQVHYRIGITGVARLAANDPSGARAEVEDALRLWATHRFGLQHWYGVFAECQIDLFEGRADEALARIEAAWGSMRGALLFLVEHVRIAALNLRARCRFAAALQAKDAKRARLLGEVASDARRLSREGGGWGPAFSALLLARLRALGGEVDASRGDLIAAADRLANLGLALHAMSARRYAGELARDEAGAKLVTDADAWMHARSIADPARLARALCT